jgi:WD40 repeat protein
VLASVSHDKTMRFWDLHTRHEIDVVEAAHDSPIHSLEYCETREELATAAHEPNVKIWCSFKHSLKMVLTGHTADVTQVSPQNQYISGPLV